MDRGRYVDRRRPIAAAAWIVAGVLSLVAASLPWTSRGVLSSASLLDASSLVRRGAVDAVVPQGAAVVLVLPALAGVLLIGLGGLPGMTARTLRVVVTLVGGATVVLLAARLADGDPTRLGAGAVLALAAVVLAAAAVALDVWLLRAARAAADRVADAVAD